MIVDQFPKTSVNHEKKLQETIVSKYCKRHGNGLHSTDECNALKNKLPPKDKPFRKEFNKSSSSCLIKEASVKNNVGICNAKSGTTEFKIMIDQGATKSFISKTYADSLKLQIEVQTPGFKVQISNGDIEEITKYIQMEFTIEELPGITFKEPFYILNGLLDTVLLGETFLIKNKAVINYKDGTITLIDRTVYKSESLEDWNGSLDKDILEKVCRIDNTGVSHATKEGKREFPPIKELKMQIKLLKDAIPTAKAFPIPYKMVDATKAEIKRLLDLKNLKRARARTQRLLFLFGNAMVPSVWLSIINHSTK